MSNSKTPSVSPPPIAVPNEPQTAGSPASNIHRQSEAVDTVEERSAPGRMGQGDDTSGQTEWVPIPEGYRSIGWIRVNEAEAAAEAYRIRTDVAVREHGTITGWARYHDDDTAEARKFHANVLLVRTRAAGERFVCWIREHEAAGIIQADRRVQPYR